MTKCLQTLASAGLLATAFGATANMQEQPASPPPKVAAAAPASTKAAEPIPLRVQVVISRYQGEKKISSLPYTLAVNANDRPSNLRMGASVPVGSFVTPKPVPEGVPTGGGPISYKDIGTNIDASASSLDDGRFKVQVTVNDTSVYGEGQSAPGAPPLTGIPTFRSFSASEMLILKDGQTVQFLTATDKVSGEVMKIDVTLTVVK